MTDCGATEETFFGPPMVCGNEMPCYRHSDDYDGTEDFERFYGLGEYNV